MIYADLVQRMGMMMLLGQHGQMQDYERGIQSIRFAAETADENAPQGAYVCHHCCIDGAELTVTLGTRHATSRRTSSG